METLAGIRMEFILFSLTLLGVAFLHGHTLYVALTGLLLVVLFKIFFTDFSLTEHFGHELMTLLNLFGLLIGFAVLARYFEESRIPQKLPSILPGGAKGGFALLALVFVMSSFLDNIAAAMIGGTMARVIFRGNVHIGYIAAIVAASNAGGAGSVVGDTTTTMMWIEGVPAADVLPAYFAALPALLIFGIFAARQQENHEPMAVDPDAASVRIDWKKLTVVLMILAGAITTNVLFDLPALGVWIAIVAGGVFSRVSWRELPSAMKGSLFLLSLVASASMMPVEELPPASWETAFSLGFISAVFDNIPLTKLALEQGGYDWGVVAYSVGFGGSMIWFGSSAGVAIGNIFGKVRSVPLWLKYGWHVIVAYVVSFIVMLWIHGWQPDNIN